MYDHQLKRLSEHHEIIQIEGEWALMRVDKGVPNIRGRFWWKHLKCGLLHGGQWVDKDDTGPMYEEFCDNCQQHIPRNLLTLGKLLS